MASSNWLTSQLTYTEAPPFHALTLWPPILIAPQSQSPVQPPLEDRTIYTSLCTSPAHYNHILEAPPYCEPHTGDGTPTIYFLSARVLPMQISSVNYPPMPRILIKSLSSGSTRRNTGIQIAKVHCCPPHTKPSTNRNPGPFRPWFTQELLSAIKGKHKHYRTYLKDKSNSNWQQFTTKGNKVTTLLRNANSVFVQSATTDATRNAHLHHIMKCLKRKTTTPIPNLHHPPHEATTAQDKANMLNRFFIQQSEQSVAHSPQQLRLSAPPRI